MDPHQNTPFVIPSMINYNMFLCEFHPCNTLCDNIIYRYKYVSDSVNVGITFLNIEMNKLAFAIQGILLNTQAFIFHKVAYSGCNVPLKEIHRV
jgi:hypothetical protein